MRLFLSLSIPNGPFVKRLMISLKKLFKISQLLLNIFYNHLRLMSIRFLISFITLLNFFFISFFLKKSQIQKPDVIQTAFSTSLMSFMILPKSYSQEKKEQLFVQALFISHHPFGILSY